ncbi:MAG: hypothetical protein AAF717_00460 [Bacteroidota bacterium]
MKTIRNITLAVFLLSMYCLPAQTVFEDPYGVFMINLEDDLELKTQKLEQVYTFSGSNYGIVAQKNVAPTTLEGMYALGIQSLLDAGFKAPKSLVPERRMFVNGNAAQMGTYTSKVDYNGIEVDLKGVILAVQLGNTYMTLTSVTNEDNYKKNRPAIERSYESIRLIGQEVTGITSVEEIRYAIEEVVEKSRIPEMGDTGETTVAVFEELTFELPSGWSKQPRNRSDSELVLGSIKNDVLAANCTLMGLKGIIWNKKRAIGVAEQTAATALPGATVLKNEDIKLGNKQKARIMVCQGQTVAEGNEVTLNMTFLTHKVGKYFVLYIMSGAPDRQDQVEKALLFIANSAKI